MAEELNAKKIRWTNRVKWQLEDTLEYWCNRNQSNTYALKIVDRLENTLTFITLNPLASAPTNFPSTRRCVMGNFSIVYKIEKDYIFVTSFWDNRMNPDKLDDQITSSF